MQQEYCMYLRKSRADLEAEARGEGETLKRHEKILLELSRKINKPITKIYREIVSGETIASRPVVQQVLAEVENGLWKGVFVVEVERLARGDTMDQGLVAQTFKYSNTEIITPVKTYNPNDEFDEEYFEFGLFMSRREYKTINRRLQRGRTLSAKEGKYLGNIPPYGYNRKKLENDSGFTLEINPEEAPIVKYIYQLYTGLNCDRIGVSLIVNKLNDMKVPTRKGGDWTTSTIRGILSNPVYIGKIRWKARAQVKKMVEGQMIIERPRAKDAIIVDGLHEAIIDEETYSVAQKYLSENPSLPIPTRHKTKNPLAGLIVCGMCGRKMNRRPYQNNYPDTLMCVGPTCPNISSHLYLVEERLIQALEKWLSSYKIDLRDQEEQNSNIEVDIIKQSILSIDEDLAVLNKQLDSLHDLLEQGVYSTEVFMQRNRIIKDKIDSSEAHKRKLEGQLNNISSIEKERRTFIPKIENVLNIYDNLESPKEKNELLKEILDKVVYIKTEGGRWSGKAEAFDIILYPKLPQV